MYKVHDKVSWLADGQRNYGFIRALVDRGAYVTAMIEQYKNHVEVPLEQLILEPIYSKENLCSRYKGGFETVNQDWRVDYDKTKGDELHLIRVPVMNRPDVRLLGQYRRVWCHDILTQIGKVNITIYLENWMIRERNRGDFDETI